MYVVDTSNLCQISAAGVLFYTVLVHPLLQKAKVGYLHVFSRPIIVNFLVSTGFN